MSGGVQSYFGPSSDSYLVVPRTVLQSQPAEWQERFLELMKELDRWCADSGIEYGPYKVLYEGPELRFGPDPIPDHDGGRARVGPQPLVDILMQDLDEHDDDQTV